MTNTDYSKIGPQLEQALNEVKQENKTLLEQDRKHKVQRDILQEQLNSLSDLKEDRDMLKIANNNLQDQVKELRSENQHYEQMKKSYNIQVELIGKLENKINLLRSVLLNVIDQIA